MIQQLTAVRQKKHYGSENSEPRCVSTSLFGHPIAYLFGRSRSLCCISVSTRMNCNPPVCCLRSSLFQATSFAHPSSSLGTPQNSVDALSSVNKQQAVPQLISKQPCLSVGSKHSQNHVPLMDLNRPTSQRSSSGALVSETEFTGQ